MQVGEVDIKWLGHAGFVISNSNSEKIIYIDPYNIKENSEKADLVLLTHSHYDHCSLEDLRKIATPNTKIVMTGDCQSKIILLDFPVKMQVVEPGEDFVFNGIRISCLPAYNVDKHFHTREEHWVGYLIKMKDVLIYHAGDTDKISEMQKLTGHKHPGVKFVALLPVGGRFTMSSEEAAEAAKLIKPDYAIPMHYGAIVGNQEDAEEFVELCKEENINALILEKS